MNALAYETPSLSGGFAQDDMPQSAIWSFMGQGGGSGVTSLCISVACELVNFFKSERRDSLPKVCLIDTDFENGTVTDYLDIEPGLSVSDLSMPATRMDASLLSSLAVGHDCGFDVIAAPNVLNGNGTINPDLVLTILDVASDAYDYIIIDVPRLWTPWTHASIGASDRFNLVTELNVPALRKLPSRIETIQQAVGAGSIGVILNKFERRSFRNSLKIGDVTHQIKRKPEGVVCIYGDLVREAINRGIPVTVQHPDGRYAKDIRDFVKPWMKEHEALKASLKRGG